MFGLLQLELPFFGVLGGKPGAARDRPRATTPPEEPRQISLGGQSVRYVIRRSSRRRTLGLTIDTRGLRVAAPLRARQAEIDKLILSSARWVLAKLAEWQRPGQPGAGPWTLAEPLALLGTSRPLKVAPGRPGLAQFDDCLILTVPRPGDEATVRARLREAIKAEARGYFSGRLTHYCAQFGVAMPDLRLSRAATRWGSCARDREGRHRVTLNWRMVHFAPHLIDYVIAHEVAHIKHMHHGPRFWAAVERLYPDYRAARDEIKRRALELPEI